MRGTTPGLEIVALLLGSGCFGGQRLTDTDPNPLESEPDNTDAAGVIPAAELCPAEDFAAECGADAATSLVATSTSPGRIDVEHRGLELGCGSWSADATVDGDVITITYLSAEDTTADCACAWNFTYWLPVGAAGTWTVEAEGESAVVTVR
jgi:hypothetical protein